MKFTLLDTELGVGLNDQNAIRLKEKKGRKNIPKFLELFQKYEIHATWQF